MFLKKIYIENFKGIAKFEVNFEANKNNINKDVALGRFKLIDGEVPIPGIVSFLGRNAVGKTTIISAISLITDLKTDFITKGIINNLIKQETSYLMMKKNDAENNFLNNQDAIIKYQKESQNLSNEISRGIREKSGRYFNRFLSDVSEWIAKYYEKNSNDKTNDKITFKFMFVGKNNKRGTIETILTKDGIWKENIKGDIKQKEYSNYFKKVMLPFRAYSFSNHITPFMDLEFPIKSYYNEKEIYQNIDHLLNLIGEEKTLSLMKMADEVVKDIKITKDKNGTYLIKQIILWNNSIIQPESLSSGTKQFLSLSEAIIRSLKIIKNEGGLILIDEIESSLHNELIQTIYQMLYEAFELKGIQTIITTHNVNALKPLISNKQIFSLEKADDVITTTKLSKIMKPHENILNKYNKGIIAPYPDPEWARNMIGKILSDI